MCWTSKLFETCETVIAMYIHCMIVYIFKYILSAYKNSVFSHVHLQRHFLQHFVSFINDKRSSKQAVFIYELDNCGCVCMFVRLWISSCKTILFIITSQKFCILFLVWTIASCTAVWINFCGEFHASKQQQIQTRPKLHIQEFGKRTTRTK